MAYEEAKAKLEREAKEGTYDRYAAAMKSAVLDALIDFAQQDEEFARAVLDGCPICKHAMSDLMKEPCSRCMNGSNWEWREVVDAAD